MNLNDVYVLSASVWIFEEVMRDAMPDEVPHRQHVTRTLSLSLEASGAGWLLSNQDAQCVAHPYKGKVIPLRGIGGDQ